MFRNVVQSMLGTARSIERLPLLVHRASNGDFSNVVRAVMGDGPPPAPPAPRGIFLTLLCNESVNQIAVSQVAAATRNSFFGDAPIRSQMTQCSVWPKRQPEQGFFAPANVEVPLLALSGELDPITPPRYADSVVAHIRNSSRVARHVVLSNRSHGDVDTCITALVEQFLMRPIVSALDARCSSQARLTFQLR
jgi:pimeloyl-ACP methyl ester carboxylesterase